MIDDNEGCTCPHYLVDKSDPEPYHPENVERDEDPNCPVHGQLVAASDRELTRRVAWAMGWIVEAHGISDTFWRRDVAMQVHCKYDALSQLTEGGVYSDVGLHTLWDDFGRSVMMLLGRDFLRVRI